MIKIENISFSYGSNKILKSINFEIPTGQINVLVGSNGSGKTTLFNILVRLLKQDEGKITLFENNNVIELKNKDLGVIFQTNTSDDKLTLIENLYLHASLYSLKKEDVKYQIEKYLSMFSLINEKNKIVKTLSGGSKRKIDIIKSLLHNPKILIYDEPFVNIDVETKSEIWSILQENVKSKNLTLLFSTHTLSEVEQAHNIFIIKSGELVYNDSLNNFKKYLSHKVITIPLNYYSSNKENLEKFNFKKIAQTESIVKLKIEEIELLKTFLEQNSELYNHITISNPEIEDIYLNSFSSKN